MSRAVHRLVDRSELVDAAAELLDGGYRLALVAGHHDPTAFRVVFVLTRASVVRELSVSVPVLDPRLPSIAHLSYTGGRFERELRDMFGIEPVGHPMPRRLVMHGHWPQDWYPMRRTGRRDGGSGEGHDEGHDEGSVPDFAEDVGSFPFLEVAGDGVYEIPVGPVHAGLIEPGHFRFSVVGETILRMKARLWFVHRGVEKLFEGADVEHAVALAERISGDTAVGHAHALLSAVEDAAGIEVDLPARRLRALLLELERLHNHVADLGALGTDVAFGIAGVHAQRLREKLLRLNRSVTGHRLLRGGLYLGGARVRRLPTDRELAEIAEEIAELAEVTLGHAVVLDRFTGTARLSAEQASQLGTLGYVARASGLDVDARRDHPQLDLGPAFSVVTEPGGDVLARYRVRMRECAVSAAVIRDLLTRELPEPSPAWTLPGADQVPGLAGTGPLGWLGRPRSGVGLVEGWRGTICHRVELDDAGRLARVRVVDPSFVNWPALPVALADTIVPDFPLANKSFNQSYAGNDL
ncbi:MAG: NADH-quinone oxidoreductase subunit C [Kineosporiaceae bacterium]|nr:NADH-quinone oxidoreductase subunit C [Kineosporiaceae bacterium]